MVLKHVVHRFKLQDS